VSGSSCAVFEERRDVIASALEASCAVQNWDAAARMLASGGRGPAYVAVVGLTPDFGENYADEVILKPDALFG
jgi:hypothetical protein